MPLSPRSHPHARHVGGSLAHADPAAELPADAGVGCAFRVQVARHRATSRRQIFSRVVFHGARAWRVTTEIAIPAPGWPSARIRVSRVLAPPRRLRAPPCCRERGIEHKVMRGRAHRVFGVGDRAARRVQAAASLIGQKQEQMPSAPRHTRPATDEIDPTSDIHASSRYRRHLAEVLSAPRARARVRNRAK